MARPDRIEGLAIVSADGMIANARGIQPDALKLEADQRFFHAKLDKATALCEAAFGVLLTCDGERFTPAGAYGVPPAFAAFRDQRGAFPPPPGSSLNRLVDGESVVHIADVTTDAGQAATALVELGGCRTLVCVALRKDNRLIG